MNIASNLPLPEEIILSIMSKLDRNSLMHFSQASKTLSRISQKVFAILFEKECMLEDYAESQQKACSLRERYLFNYGISNTAKRAWIKNSLNILQYKKIKPFCVNAQNQGIYQFQPPKEVNSLSITPSLTFLYSDDGSRMQETKLMQNKEQNSRFFEFYRVPLMKEFEKSLGLIKAAIPFNKHLFLLTEINSSLSLVIKDLTNVSQDTVVNLAIHDVISHAYQDGVLALGTRNEGLVLVPLKTMFKPSSKFDPVNILNSQPIEWMGFLKEGQFFLKSEGKFYHISKDFKILASQHLPESLRNFIIFNNQLLMLSESKLLSYSSENKETTLIKENIKDIIPLLNDKFLLHSLDEVLELWSENDKMSKLNFENNNTIVCAIEREGLIALALSDQTILMLKTCEDGTLEEINRFTAFKETKRDIHALSFTGVLELFITTKNGSIFSIQPFPMKK